LWSGKKNGIFYVKSRSQKAAAMLETTFKERRIAWLLFAAIFLSFAYFHQGGGWNQNARFALVRSIVEEGNFSIDSYLVYAGVKTGQGTRLVRVPVRNAGFSLDGRNYAFHWKDVNGNPISLAEADAGAPGGRPGVTSVEPEQVAVSGDIAFFRGHFHPNKAPGASFASVPAYLLIYNMERMFGLDPDAWWTLTVNAWLTSAFSVGLLSALGCVLFYKLALKLSGNREMESLLTTLTFAFGTMFFPYGTALYEHNVIAVALLASFYLLYRVKESGMSPGPPLTDSRAKTYITLAGLCAGCAAITNYVMVIVVVLLGCYLLFGVRWKGGWQWYVLGLLGPLLLILFYNMSCFSTPFTTNYRYENPAFKTGSGAFLNLFLLPQWDVLFMVLFSPYRGLFISAPSLLLSVYGLTAWIRSAKLRPEALLIVSVLAFFLLFIASFNGWHGGWAVGPRYLAPALPFLALPLVSSFTRFFKTACVLAVLSVGITLLVTAVDPQAPVGNAGNALVEGRAQWKYSPLTEYEWPLFSEGHPWPLLRAQQDHLLRSYGDMLQAMGEPAPMRVQRLAVLRDEIDADIRSGEPAPLMPARGSDARTVPMLSELTTFVGPVSVNPIGVYEGWMYQVFPAHSREAEWNSFNAGEFLVERSRWSLMPLLIIAGLLVALALRTAARLGHG
jgi:hypothetical protein